MFSFFRKKTEVNSTYFPIAVDMHSHVLPGLDDGSPDVETSVRLIRGMSELGIKKLIATPHIISDLYRNNPQKINAALALLRNALTENNIPVQISAAAEYMMDSYFLELLAGSESLMTIQDKVILTEFSYAAKPNEPEKFSFAIQTAGYSPILAHPERYAYYHGNYSIYHRLVDLGFMLQLNALSLTGYYGKGAVKAAEYMIKHGLISYVGTDLHHERHLAIFQDNRTRELLHKNLSHQSWNDFLL
jgi:tyrosine-protein phosphatase YwqE